MKFLKCSLIFESADFVGMFGRLLGVLGGKSVGAGGAHCLITAAQIGS